MAESLDKQIAWYVEELDFPGSVFVDAGANEGVLLRALWDAVGGGFEVHAVEPLAENIARLRARTPPGASWTVHEAVLTDADEPRQVRLEHEGPSGHNCVVRASGEGDREVAGRRLSTLVPHATIVKLDVEGHEYTILDEALDALPDITAWAIEFHMSAGRPLRGALGALARRGYSLRAAGRRASDPGGPWVSANIPPTLEWAQIPPAQRNPDGSVFKMVHVIAKRDATPLG
ncbi:MAG: FkbM family methyltransferase [Nannocystaceae bacterium]|nr:FkbM family methyltransferase [bacterium]